MHDDGQSQRCEGEIIDEKVDSPPKQQCTVFERQESAILKKPSCMLLIILGHTIAKRKKETAQAVKKHSPQ